MAQTVVLKVGMSCQGCSGAVRRVLDKMEGVESFDINMDLQKVTVTGNVQPDFVFQTVSKTGKKTAFWEPELPPPAQPEIPQSTEPELPPPAQPELKPSPTEPAPAEAVPIA